MNELETLRQSLASGTLSWAEIKQARKRIEALTKLIDKQRKQPPQLTFDR